MSKPLDFVPTLAKRLAVIMLVLLPFHAFLTVFGAQLLGHYTLLRLWKEILLLVLVFIAGFVLYRDRQSGTLLRDMARSWLFRCIATYGLIQLVWGVAAFAYHSVTMKALSYGVLSDTRFLVFFVVLWILAHKIPQIRAVWPKVVVWPLAVVVVIGLLQYFVLPYDFLRHFGYNESTIFPYETINHNLSYVRIMSTLRGANPLGAYLVLAISLLLALRPRWRQKSWLLLLAGSLLALLLTFSRSAWLGLAVSGAVLVFVRIRRSRHFQRLLFPAVGVGLVIAAVLVLALRHNVAFQNAFLHTQDHSKIATSSNQGHVSALKNGVTDMLHQPLGRGPGTAGPASVYNGSHPSRIAENYFIQVGQETGWLGLAAFLAINYFVAAALWRRRGDPLALGLLAALAGITVVNLLSHAWADDTLAYLFWGLAGVALAGNASTKRKQPDA